MRESQIADLLSEALVRFPSIKIGSYPTWGETGYRVKIVVESKDRSSVASAAEHLRKTLG
jgi:molybdopterin-biosynthesis enzyme MoeA-like protein